MIVCSKCGESIVGLVSRHHELEHGLVWIPGVRRWFKLSHRSTIGGRARWKDHKQRPREDNETAALDTPGRIRADGDVLNDLRSIIEQLLVKRGLDPFTCGLCGLIQTRRCIIHHTKYVGATINDLVYACQSCNMKVENIGLL